MRFKKEALFILSLIRQKDKTNWYSKNNPYKWFLIRVEQYLNGPQGSTPQGGLIYNKCIKAQENPSPKNPIFWEIVDAMED